MADGADMWPLTSVLPQVIQVEVAEMESFSAGGAAELFRLSMTLLMCPKGGAAAEGLQTNFTVERFGCGAAPSVGGAAHLVFVAMNELLVFLQLTVVEKGLSTEVTHERLLCSMDQHVGLQSPRSCKALATFIAPETRQETLQMEVFRCVADVSLCICSRKKKTGCKLDKFKPRT